MICPKCGKEEYDDDAKVCFYCKTPFDVNTVATTERVPVEYHSTEPITPNTPKNAFKENFWISFVITIVGLFFGVGLFASIIVWIVYLCMKKEGANGWIAGWGTALGTLLLVFGGCFLAITGGFH